MREQAPAFMGGRHEAAATEHDVMPHRVGVGIHVPRRLPGDRTRMHSNTREVVAEMWFHECSRRRIERLAGPAQCFVDDERYCGLSHGASPPGYATGRAALELRLRCPHYLFGNAVCFLFIVIALAFNRRLRLDHSCGRRINRDAAKIRPKAKRRRGVRRMLPMTRPSGLIRLAKAEIRPFSRVTLLLCQGLHDAYLMPAPSPQRHHT